MTPLCYFFSYCKCLQISPHVCKDKNLKSKKCRKTWSEKLIFFCVRSGCSLEVPASSPTWCWESIWRQIAKVSALSNHTHTAHAHILQVLSWLPLSEIETIYGIFCPACPSNLSFGPTNVLFLRELLLFHQVIKILLRWHIHTGMRFSILRHLHFTTKLTIAVKTSHWNYRSINSWPHFPLPWPLAHFPLWHHCRKALKALFYVRKNTACAETLMIVPKLSVWTSLFFSVQLHNVMSHVFSFKLTVTRTLLPQIHLVVDSAFHMIVKCTAVYSLSLVQKSSQSHQ